MRRNALRAGLGALSIAAGLAVTGAGAYADDPKPGPATSLATVPYQTITSTGPLTDIRLGNDLSCQVNHLTLGASGQAYGPSNEPADCGTFLAVGGTLYTPNFGAHGYSATPFPYTPTSVPFTPVLQTAPTGSGTLADPFIVTTVADAGTTGLRITQIDTYVTGQSSYRTDVVLTNNTTQNQAVRLYHGIDCYLGGSDTGNGVAVTSPATATSRVGCTSPNRVEQLVAITAGNGYYEDFYGSVWDRINTRLPLPNTVQPAKVDNGIAIDWAVNLPPNGSVIRSFLTDFVNSAIVIDDRLPNDRIRAAVILRQGDSGVPGGGAYVTVDVAGQQSAFAVLIPTGPQS
jgi:hypothetical protein